MSGSTSIVISRVCPESSQSVVVTDAEHRVYLDLGTYIDSFRRRVTPFPILEILVRPCLRIDNAGSTDGGQVFEHACSITLISHFGNEVSELPQTYWWELIEV